MVTESPVARSKQNTLIDQRRNRRYHLSLQVNIRSELDSVIASSRNISVTGIYLEIPNNFELNSQLEFDMEFPPELTNGTAGRIRCKATIVRVDRSKEIPTVGVAAQIRSYRFLRVN